MANASAALKSARAYLRDINAVTWTDAILFPFLQEAHGELIQELELNDIGDIHRTSAIILVPAGNLSLPMQPVEMIDPISLMERRPHGNLDDFIDMHRVTWTPQDDP